MTENVPKLISDAKPQIQQALLQVKKKILKEASGKEHIIEKQK